jgi:hypothetical protein
MCLLRACFARTQTWLQAGKYINALVSGLPSRNGWTIAEQAWDRSPAKTQRLLNRASWDEARAMSEVRRYAAAGLDAAARRSRRRRMSVGALDETGQEKQGTLCRRRHKDPYDDPAVMPRPCADWLRRGTRFEGARHNRLSMALAG